MINNLSVVLSAVTAMSIIFAACGDDEPEVTQAALDSAVSEIRTEIDSLKLAVADVQETVNEAVIDNEPDAISANDLREAIADLTLQIAALDEQITQLQTPAPKPEPVLAEDVFADIFQNATRVDRVSTDDIINCNVTSKYELELGDKATVEVAFARKEDSRTGGLPRPLFSMIRDTSGDDVLGNDVSIQHQSFGLQRIIANPWNEANTGPYVIAVYRGSSPVGPELYETTPVGTWVSNFGALVPGVYTLSLVEDESVASLCHDLRVLADPSGLIPDSMLLAWYVN